MLVKTAAWKPTLPMLSVCMSWTLVYAPARSYTVFFVSSDYKAHEFQYRVVKNLKKEGFGLSRQGMCMELNLILETLLPMTKIMSNCSLDIAENPGGYTLGNWAARAQVIEALGAVE